MPNVTEEVPDKGDLQNIVDSINNTVGPEEDYTPETWSPFEIALSDAEAVLNDINATQQEVDDAYNTLDSAFDDLELSV